MRWDNPRASIFLLPGVPKRYGAELEPQNYLICRELYISTIIGHANGRATATTIAADAALSRAAFADGYPVELGDRRRDFAGGVAELAEDSSDGVQADALERAVEVLKREVELLP